MGKMKATEKNIIMELWMRRRDELEITTRGGKHIPLKDATIEQLVDYLMRLEDIEDRREFMMDLQGDSESIY